MCVEYQIKEVSMKNLLVLLCALLLVGLPAGDAAKKPSKKLQEAMKARGCFNPDHYDKKCRHLFVLDETKLGNGDVLGEPNK